MKHIYLKHVNGTTVYIALEEEFQKRNTISCLSTKSNVLYSISKQKLKVADNVSDIHENYPKNKNVRKTLKSIKKSLDDYLDSISVTAFLLNEEKQNQPTIDLLTNIFNMYYISFKNCMIEGDYDYLKKAFRVISKYSLQEWFIKIK